MYLNKDGYPTEDALHEIKEWEYNDFWGLMDFVKSLWWMPDWGWGEKDKGNRICYAIATAGWSGNEDLISAMKSNHMFWMSCWCSSRKGGHFEFEVKRTKK